MLNAKNPSPIYIPTKEFPAPTRSLRVMSLVWTPTLPVVIVEENVETPDTFRPLENSEGLLVVILVAEISLPKVIVLLQAEI